MARSNALRGERALTAQLEALDEGAREMCADALEGWAKAVRADAERNVAVLTGDLFLALDYEVDRATLVAQVGVLEDGGQQHPGTYAPLVEGGTGRIRAQPYLEPALEKHRDVRPFVREAMERRLP